MTRRTVRQAIILVIVLTLGFFAGQLNAAQPMMQNALKQLRAAENSLERGTSDKGGHRARALEHVRAAINEVERAIEYDRHH